MKPYRNVLRLELRHFLRNKAVVLGAISLLAFAFYSFFHGNQVIEHQQQTIASVPSVQKHHLQQIVAHGAGKVAGTTAYYPFFYTINPPTPWARFTLGQRDVHPYTLKVKMLAIEGQLYDSELTNPLNLLVGNLDAAFVFLFLFPLLIIALSYNVLSEEQETGVWNIVHTSTAQLGRTIAGKLLVRFGVLLVLTLAVFAAACFCLRLPFSGPTFQLLLVVLIYVLFWFAVAALIVSLGKRSSFNATALICIWIFLAVLLPGMANTLVNSNIPIPEASETTIRQREGYHAKWDAPKKTTMEKFYAVYPQYRHYPIPDDKYSPGWYYAMQFSGDLESKHASEQLFEKLGQRQNLSEIMGWFNPLIAAQQALNQVANTDLESHVRYLQSVKAHHRQIREYFYPHIFEDTPTEKLDWAGFPPYQPVGYGNEPPTAGILVILVWSFAFLGLALLSFKRNFLTIKDLTND
ncbi:DUF3526 domain-containing protein [Siphonobacter sp. SORGH_AS_1065]|uniref:ABC transporter permease n=1 Tax=Siphonobacter sp. SORGH_AS_1065 TaxID=3041795 RepID=UPI002781B758|nr:DUF3526 domain-containing protein [Siphonobacter sp. SORGH_AS_1065]MDQ1089788.1 ABC-2 type transport system permease protein [Siphonobacter sp. SORGH_AS_1065]